MKKSIINENTIKKH
jgi:bacillolysin